MESGSESFAHILVVDDEVLTSRMLAYLIEEAELGIARQCTDSREVAAILKGEIIDLVLLDLNMPYISGREVLEAMSQTHPDIPVIILTNEDRIEVAVECMKVGAFDFMTKPIDKNRLVSAVRHGLTIRDLKREVNILSTRREERLLQNPGAFRGIITQSPAMKTIFAYIEAIAKSPKAVLITGESGTGKELVAEAIHALSGRSGRYVAINVSGLDDTIFSDSLFGHLKGSYTGADSVRKGLVDQAKDGTLFMDEIGDMEGGPQIKLLRLLQEGEYYPLGSDAPQKSRARIVAATNADLSDKQGNGGFRRDLYYRLIAHHIELPPLRERKEDIGILLEHFCAEAATALGRSAPRVPSVLVRLLSLYDFPGNIRELQGMVFDAVSRESSPVLDSAFFRDYIREHRPGLDLTFFSETKIRPEGTRLESAVLGLGEGPVPLLEAQADDDEAAQPVRPEAQQTRVPTQKPEPVSGGLQAPQGLRGPEGMSLGKTLPKLAEVEDFLFETALERSDGNQSAAAALLGVSQSTLSRWLKQRAAGK